MARKTTSPRKHPKQARARATRDALVAASAQLMASHGYGGTTTNAIAERAGVSIGSLYEYFPNKDAIVEALAEELLAEQVRVLAEALARVPGAPLVEVAREAIGALIASKRIRPRLYQALASGPPHGLRGRFVRRWNQRAYETVLALLRARPELVDPRRDLELAVFVAVNAVHGVVDAVLVERAALVDDDRLVDELVRLVTRYALG
jgi:AcrR family transcriptional regulator